MTAGVGRVDRLELDVDTRLITLWHEMVGIDEWNLPMVARCIRAAYGIGYADALLEPRRNRGQLYRDHGYQVPNRETWS